MVPISYHLMKRGNTEIICFIILNPQNKMISDMPVLMILKKSARKMCVEVFPLIKLSVSAAREST